MASPGTAMTFTEATAVKAESSHTYSLFFPEDWVIGTVPHGGYVTASFLRVASAHFSSTLSRQNQPHTIAMHVDFLRRTQIGPALFTVKDTKLGRQTSVIHITLTQNGQEEVVCILTNSNMSTESGVTFNTEYSLNPPRVPVNLTLLDQDQDPNWARMKDMPYSSFRRATEKTHFHFPRLGQVKDRIGDEWVRLANGDKWSNASIGYVCDMWPMPVDAFLKNSEEGAPKISYWFPTLLLNVDFKKALPEEGVEWLFVRAEAKQIKNGRMDVEVVIMDETGEIVALSHHVALVVSAERNIAERKGGGSKI